MLNSSKTTMLKIVYLGNKLSKHGFTPTTVETLGNRLKQDFKVVQGSSKKNQLLRLINMWWTVLLNKNADFLLIDTYSSSAFLYAWTSARLAELFNIKYVPILHGGALPSRAKKSPKVLGRLLNEAFEVVCPSAYLKVEMEQAIGGEYKIIPNFIDLQNYPYQTKASSLKDGIKLFWLRSFHKVYNPTLAIKVLKELQDQGYQVELCMVGPDKDGSIEDVKTLAKELGVESSLKLTGRLTKEEWIKLSADYNVFINTTNVDNTPVSVMEAMALGFPVVTTKVGGIPYLFEDQKEGIMIPPDDCDAFVSAITALVKDETKTQEICSNARKKAASWDWGTVRLMWKETLRK